MPAVSCHLIPSDLLRNNDRIPVGLPLAVPSGHGNYIRVAQILQRLCRERRPGTARAINHDGLLLVGEHLVGFLLQEPTGKKDRLVEMALLPLVALPDVE